jgi:hypothetical protein
MKKPKKKNVNITKELYVIFKNGNFQEAAYCLDDERLDTADRYIRECERKYGLKGFSYKWGDKAKAMLPPGYSPRQFIPRLTKTAKEMNYFIARFRAEDDGVNYED